MIQIIDLIERWGNAQRVLENMPEHERQEHWDMSIWGEQTTCGTIACAAGHCGLDPWFRERGFTLNFRDDGESEISDVKGFFGLEGSSRIFLNSTRRKVETVVEEIKTHVSELERMNALAANIRAPAIGEEWPEHGGVYAGPRISRKDGLPYFLVVGPEHEGYLNWDDATSWASKVTVGDHRDFSLPSRDEQLALFDRVRNLFKPDFYWSSETHASLSGYAWGQDFDDGYQHGWYKDYDYRALAVRRSIIR